MAIPSNETRNYLITESFTNIYIGSEPETKDICTTIFDSGEFAPTRAFDGTIITMSTIQIRVKHTDYNTGYELLQSILKKLELKKSYGSYVLSWNIFSGITHFKDMKNNIQYDFFTANLVVKMDIS